MKRSFRWIAPLILGVVEFNTLRLVTDSSRGDRIWAHPGNQINAFIATILVCYIVDYCLRKFFQKCIYQKEISIGKEYSYITFGSFIFINFFRMLFSITGFVELGEPVSDIIIVNAIYIPFTILYYTIIRNKEIANDYQQQSLQLEKIRGEQLDTELKLLKSQYHPHFLFNALNTIYFQIEDSNKQAKHSIELLSELLRYQLYTIKQKVTIKQELDYLAAYIRFQQLRMSERLVLTEEYDEQLQEQEIHPLLFQPLVENAFKYVGGDYHIHFSLKLNENKLVFTAENSTDPISMSQHKKASGLGIANMKKQLQILYPRKHQLSTHAGENTFYAELIIELTPDENKMYNN